MTTPRQLLQRLFDVAVESALPENCVPANLPDPPTGRTIVIGAGKASAAMAKALEDNWPDKLSGLVVTRYGYEVACRRIEIISASHPVPDAASETAARRMLDLLAGLSKDDLVIALISGGASSLLCLPAPGLTLADKQAVNAALLASGATISEMNAVRKKLSAVKGGRLAEAAFPAKVVSLVISDVPGDDLSIIGSGPTVADDTSASTALEVLSRYQIKAPARVMNVLEKAKAGETAHKPMRSTAILIATPGMALAAAAREARKSGFEPVMLGDALEGEASRVGRDHAKLALQSSPKSIILSGGELTVTMASGGGEGGPSSEYALALALGLDGAPGIYAIACDTDGVDGSKDNAGAFIDPQTLANADRLGLDAQHFLDAHDAWTFFDKAGGLVVTGPTFTNVNDFRAILVE
ncbi:MAG TPA: glycerate kinase [Rhizobiales bacterium]|nr:glycerate kinase [Hyphomicrobiales bacterium]